MASTYSWRHDYIISMRSRLFFLYFREAERISIEKQYNMCSVALMPYQKESKIKEIFSQFEKDLKPKQLEKSDKKETYDESWIKMRLSKDK